MDYTSILGIDVASSKLDLCLKNEKGLEYDQLDYTGDALESFLGNHPEINPTNCLVGMESTGDYHLKVLKFFLEKGFLVKVLNPILTKQYTRTTIRGTKTDKKDSELICKLISEGEGELAFLSDFSGNSKEFLRLSNTLTKYASGLKQRVQSVERKSLPETEKIVEHLKEVINSLEKLSHSLVDKATAKRSQNEELIDSIPGFALKLSAIVSWEIGDIHQFRNAKSLVAYAGLDPRIKQSGNKLHTTGRLTKRGSPHLRTALFLAANVAHQYDPELKEYYYKKKSENRTHKEILCMISRKLLARIYAVLKEQRPYLKKDESINYPQI